jgi:drug/metabolite transporter (DMT)-like permease
LTIFGFSDAGWFVLFIQAVVCQLTAWLSISYATQHMNHQGFIEFIRSAVLTSVLAWFFLDEKVTMNMIIGGLILLLGIRITFYTKTLSIKKHSSNTKENIPL